MFSAQVYVKNSSHLPQLQDGAMRQYVYISKSTFGTPTDEDLEILAAQSLERNNQDGIRGVLVLSRKFFFQWLEGPPTKIDNLVNRIRVDPRHTDFTRLIDASSVSPLMRSWTVVRVTRLESEVEILQRYNFLQAAASAGQLARVGPALLFRLFVLPADLPDSDVLVHHQEKYRVILSADDMLWPSAVVNDLARRASVKVQRTYFSVPGTSNHNIDSGVEYFDLPKSNVQPFACRYTACASPTVHSAHSDAFFADAHLIVFLVRASRQAIELERLKHLVSLPCVAIHRPHLMILFSKALQSAKEVFDTALRDCACPITYHNLSLSDANSIAKIIADQLNKLRAQQQSIVACTVSKIKTNDSDSFAAVKLVNAHHAPTTGLTPTLNRKESNMANINVNLQSIMKIDGATACALVDYNSGMMLGSVGGGINLELAAAGNTEVIRAKMRTAKSLGLDGAIEDILITLTNQYHIIRPVASKQGLFYYVVIDRSKGNLAMARYLIAEAERQLQI